MKTFLKHSIFAILGVLSKLTALSKDDSQIIFYHDVYDKVQYTPMATPLNLFLKHCRLLKSKGYVFCDNISCEKKNIQICFDDGFRGIWDCQNELLSLGISPTVFIAVDLIGKDGYLNLDEIHELQKRGFKFQSHTWSHKPLTEWQMDEELWHELYDARVKLSELLGHKVDGLCFPCGMFSPNVYYMALKAGYKKLYSSIPGYASQMIMPHVYARNLVQFLSPFDFKCVLMGAMSLMRSRYRKKHFINN